MVRPLFVVVAAILLSQPELPRDEAARYAHVLIEEAKARDFDPFTIIAIIHHESGWNPAAISRSGEDYGLGQIRARYVGACKRDLDPLRAPSAACRAEKTRLLDGEENIRTMAELVTRHRELCKEKTGSASLPRWLASYQGRNYPKQRRWCQPGDGTWKVVNYRKWLIERTQPLKPPRDDGQSSSPTK
ncbi:MAG: transglycosylase SLT domain-containing protein [Polyangiaceae bacterium]|nr:transglycosylase SLT domain-containing protein [Polyangiaceae bacterium]